MRQSVVLSAQQTQFQAATFSGDLADNLSCIAGLGYCGVELAIRDPKLVNLESLVEFLHRFGLAVPAIGTGQAWNEEGLSFTDPDPAVRRAAIERIKSHVPLAKRFNAVIIIGLIRGKFVEGVEKSEAMQWLTQALRECSLTAESDGVRLALEPINRYETSLINSAHEGMELVSWVNSPNFGLLLDTFHMNIEEVNITSSLHFCGDRIFHFHVADSNRWNPGKGHLDFQSILGSLKNIGYDGYISGEFLPLPDAVTAAMESFNYLQPMIEKVQNAD